MNDDQAFSNLYMTHPDGAKLTFCRYGGHITGWQTAQGESWLYLSALADLTPGKSIRGGIPIIFPQFSGFGTGLRHGFARILPWQISQSPKILENITQNSLNNISPQNSFNNIIQCRLKLHSNADTLNLWPHHFCLELIINLGADTLDVQLFVTNTDTTAWSFAAALHTYFAVQNLANTTLLGLNNTPYWDNNGSDFKHDRFRFEKDELPLQGAIDRVFFDAKKPVTLVDGQRQLHIKSSGFADVVVWNPGQEGARQLADMPDQDFNHFVCVEAAQVDKPIHLEPGATWVGSQHLTSQTV